MPELISTPLIIFFSIIIIGIVIEGFHKGFNNLTDWEKVLFIVAVIILAWSVFGGTFNSPYNNEYSPPGIEDYNSSPYNPYGN